MGNTPNIRFKGFTDDWEQRKLGEVFQEYSEKNHPELPALTIIQGGGTVLREESERKLQYDKSSLAGYKMVREDDFIVHLRSFEGGLEKSNHNGLISPAYHTFHGYEVDSRFYYPYFRSYEFIKHKLVPHVYGIRDGRSIDIDGMKTIEIPWTSYEEQKKIGDYIESLDTLITLHQRKCDETKKLKKFMLQKMFPKKDAKKPEIRFAGFTDDWEQRKLGEIITEYKETVDSDCTLPILTSSKTEGVILQEEHFGRKQQHDITGYNILPRNYCTYRNRSDGVDFTFNINKCCDKGIISKFYPVFSGKNSDVFFLSLVLNNSEEVVHEIAYTCTGTGQKVLSFLDLQKMKVRVPNFDEQKEIAAYFESLDHLITLHQRKCDELKEFKKYMLQNMFPQKG